MTKKTLNNKLYLAETSNVTGYRTLIERAYEELREDIVNGKLKEEEITNIVCI